MDNSKFCECCGEPGAEYYMEKYGRFICDTCACLIALNAPVSGNERYCREKCFEAAGIVHIDNMHDSHCDEKDCEAEEK